MDIPGIKFNVEYGVAGLVLLRWIPGIRRFMEINGASTHWNEMHLSAGFILSFEVDKNDYNKALKGYFMRKVGKKYEYFIEIGTVIFGRDSKMFVIDFRSKSGERVSLMITPDGILVDYAKNTLVPSEKIEFYDNPYVSMCVEHVWNNHSNLNVPRQGEPDVQMAPTGDIQGVYTVQKGRR